MTDRQALERAICVHPDEDVPRLAFADCLEENAESVACETCEGDGHRIIRRSNLGSFGKNVPVRVRLPEYRCSFCSGSGRVSPDAERAEFIRAGIELTRIGEECKVIAAVGKGALSCFEWKERVPSTDSWCGPCQQRKQLIARHAAMLARGRAFGWFDVPDADTDALEPGFDLAWVFGHGVRISGTVRRGFVEAISLDSRAFTEAVARAVFGVMPVTAVTLSDREPYFGGNVYSWYDFDRDVRSGTHPGSDLPRCIFVHLLDRKSHMVEFPTRELALQAPSDACVSWGRSLVGLPPLRRTTAASSQETAWTSAS